MKTYKKSQQIFKLITGILPVVISASFLMSCGAAKSGAGSSDEASRALSTSAKPLAYCNQATDAAHSLVANLGAYLNSSGGVDLNYIHVKLSNVPATFTDNSHYFSFFKWSADASGTLSTFNQALSFKIINIQSGQDLTGSLTTLSWNTVSAMATSLGATTPTAFFQKVRILVYINDPTGSYQAMTISYHKAATGVADNRIDALMPLFDADPRTYSASHAKILSNIHPFATANYSTWTDSVFTANADAFCGPLNQF